MPTMTCKLVRNSILIAINLVTFITDISYATKHHCAFVSHNKQAVYHNRLPFLYQTNDSNNNKLRKEGPKNESTSRNEFSRTIRVNKWFSSISAGGSTSRQKNKSLNLSISATETEMTALAARFHLANITSLSAELVVSPALGLGGGTSDQDSCIEVRGTISTQVKQTCVRTNENFDVDLEFNFDTTLKAMAATSGSSGLSTGEMEAVMAAAQFDRKKNRNKKQTSVKSVKGGARQDLDMKELQNILTEYEVTDDIIEDESCFCTDGIVDVGEIVSQMFRSKLDPYPKKPGSDPVKYTFTF